MRGKVDVIEVHSFAERIAFGEEHLRELLAEDDRVIVRAHVFRTKARAMHDRNIECTKIVGRDRAALHHNAGIGRQRCFALDEDSSKPSTAVPICRWQ
jgi:hypothetical protein